MDSLPELFPKEFMELAWVGFFIDTVCILEPMHECPLHTSANKISPSPFPPGLEEAVQLVRLKPYHFLLKKFC